MKTTNTVDFALWLLAELDAEYRVDVLRVLLPDCKLPLLRTLAAMIHEWYVLPKVPVYRMEVN